MNTIKIKVRSAHQQVPHRHIAKASMTVILTAVLVAGMANGTPRGELDATFGENGRLIIPGSGHDYGSAIAQQPADGKLVMVVDYFGDEEADHITVLRQNVDGSPDTTFGSNGVAVIYFGNPVELAREIVVQPDGKIIVAGGAVGSTYPGDFALARLNADGTIDATFGADGLVTLNLGGNYEYIGGVSLLPNDQIVVTGTTNARGLANYDVAFARFHADGQIDTTFGTGTVAGTTIVDPNSQNEFAKGDEPVAITRQIDGKHVACGFADTDYWDYVGSMLAVRINADGSVDSGFGTDGVTRIQTDSEAQTCIAMPDGSVMVAGQGYGNYQGNVLLARLTSDGLKDLTFGDSGILSIDFGGRAESVDALTFLDNGDLGATGAAYTDTNIDMFIARLDVSGASLDPGFGNNGVTIVDFGRAGQAVSSGGSRLIQQADGKLVASGWSSSDAAYLSVLARVDPEGNGSTGFAGLRQTAATVPEQITEIFLTVRRTGGSSGELSVDYDTLAGSAMAPGDFTTTFGTLTWPNGDMDPKVFTVPITSDSTAESEEYFTVALSNSTGGLASSEFRVTIASEIAPQSPPPPPRSAPPSASGSGSIDVGLLLLLAIFFIARVSRARTRKRDSDLIAKGRMLFLLRRIVTQ